MAQILIEHPARGETWEEVKPGLETAVAELEQGLPVPLETRWNAESLHLSGGGAEVTICLVQRHINAETVLGPPASFFRAVIEREIRRALEKL